MESTNNGIKKKYAFNPRIEASLLSRLGFCWVVPLLIKGYSKDLVEEDLFEPLEEHQSNILGDKLEKAWTEECSNNKNPSLWMALVKAFGFEFGCYGPVLIFLEICKMSQPICLSRLLAYFQPEQSEMTRNEAVMYAGLIFAGSLFNVLGRHVYIFGLEHMGMKLRVACSSLIYRKSLRLSRNTVGDKTIGKMVNLLSNDVTRFDYFLMNFHMLWFVPIEIVAISFLLHWLVGFTSAVGVTFLALYLPLQVYLGNKYSKLRLKTALQTDERVRLMTEIIAGIQVIKMYTWERPFSKLIDLTRRMEMKYIRKTYYLDGILFSIGFFSTRLTLFLTLVTSVLLGHTLTSDYVFVMYSFFYMLRQCLTHYFLQGISHLAETKISVDRIKKFLLYDEVIQNRLCEEIPTKDKFVQGNTTSVVKARTLIISDATANWCLNDSDNTLKNINIETKSKDLVVIIGTVGSGKSSLLQVILQELPLKEGFLNYQGTISYASQEPWIFGASVQQNILFGQDYDKNKYHKVIEVCALELDLRSFPYGDKSFVGERGIMISGGQKARINLARAIYKDADIYLLDDSLSAVDNHVGKHIFDKCIRGYLKNKTVILVTHQLQYLRNVDNIILMQKGEINNRGNYNQIQELDPDGIKNMQLDAVEHNEDEVYHEMKTAEGFSEGKEIEESHRTGGIDASMYVTYVKAMGNYWFTAMILLFIVLARFVASGSDWYLTYWVHFEQQNKRYEQNSTSNEVIFKSSRYTHLVTYAIIIILTISFSFLRSIGIALISTRASTKLHNKMFKSMINAPMSFFKQSSSGRILNRFSKDIGTLDLFLPHALVDTIQVALNIFCISLVIGLVNPWFLLVSCNILVLFYYMRVVYLKTSTDIKRLESITKSPVLAHVTTSMQGVATIRAFNAESILVKEFDSFQDKHTSAWFMMLATNQLFGYWLDLICVMYIGMVTFSFIFIDTLHTGENVGLAITQALALAGTSQWGMRQWSELESQMTLIERAVEYIKIMSERHTIRSANIYSWPTNGRVEFKSVSLRYTTDGPLILRNLNFVIESEKKIGVVGRTGAGKTSLIAALFQLTDTEGEILIDGVNIYSLPLSELRSSISIIPQDPVIFSGTLRKNLDPFDEFQDEDLWCALAEVELKHIVTQLPTGLNAKMLDGGTNFSVGQRQLLCLARALARRNKILILDEATANVDPQTDNLIQKTIRRKFASCTVITIAHRLNTIIDSDKVLVMQEGTIIEFDHPHSLLQIQNGVFNGMVEKTGRNMADKLRKTAKTTFNKKYLQ